jgi:hypothetical protein
MDEDVPDLIEMYADEMRRRGDTDGSIRGTWIAGSTT